MLADSAHIQEKDAEFLAKRKKEFIEPLYGIRHAVRTMELMVARPVQQAIRCSAGSSGHLCGCRPYPGISVRDTRLCRRRTRARRLVFSGDIGRSGLAIIRDPVPPTGAHELIMESTYGDRDHESVDGARARLAEIVRDTAARGGRVLIPAFAVGRTQEIIYNLHSLFRESAIPAIPIYVDSPLAIDTTTVFEMHPETFDQSEDMVKKVQELFDFPLVHYTRDVEESKALAAHERADDHHCGIRDGGGRTHSPSSGSGSVESTEYDSDCWLSGGAYAWPADRGESADASRYLAKRFHYGHCRSHQWLQRSC